MLRVQIVHKERHALDALVRVLQGEPCLRVVGVALDMGETLARLKISPCDIMLVHSASPDEEILGFTRRVTQLNAEIKVLVMGVARETENVIQYLEAGAIGYILHGHSLAELVQRIRAAAQGESLVSPEIATILASRLAELERNVKRARIDPAFLLLPPHRELTPRQREILTYLQQGYTNQEIADILYVEVGTVKNHVHAVLQKLGVSNRKDAAELADLMLETGTERLSLRPEAYP